MEGLSFAHRSSEPQEQSYEGERNASAPLMLGSKVIDWDAICFCDVGSYSLDTR
jgi:hypothetical protein